MILMQKGMKRKQSDLEKRIIYSQAKDREREKGSKDLSSIEKVSLFHSPLCCTFRDAELHWRRIVWVSQ